MRVRDRQPAAFRHCVPGIQEQIQEHLLQFVLESQHDHRRFAQLAPHPDAMRFKLMLEQAQHVGDHDVDVERRAIARGRP